MSSNVHRGTVVTVVLHAVTPGKLWIKQMLLSSLLLPVLVCGTAFFINFIAIGYHASRAIPFSSMVRLISMSTVSCIRKLNCCGCSYVLVLRSCYEWMMRCGMIIVTFVDQCSYASWKVLDFYLKFWGPESPGKWVWSWKVLEIEV